jgi:hypothetical protein
VDLKGARPGLLRLGDARLVTTFVVVGLTGAALTVGAAIGPGEVAAVSVAMGALTALSNLYVLTRIVALVAAPYEDAKTNGAFVWGVIALGKILVLFGGLWFLMTRHMVDPIPLVVGYGSLPIGIAIGAVVSDKTGPRLS